MSKHRYEPGIVHRVAGKVSSLLLAREKDGLGRTRTAVGLNPRPSCTVHSPMPYTHGFGPKNLVRHLENNAADVLFGEKIVTSELKVVQGALGIEEEGITAPAGEETIFPGRRHS